jgi:hypothetical protein
VRIGEIGRVAGTTARPGGAEPSAVRWSVPPARWPAGVLFAVVAGGYTAGTLAAFTWFDALGIGLPVFFPSAGLTLGVLVACGGRRWPRRSRAPGPRPP